MTDVTKICPRYQLLLSVTESQWHQTVVLAAHRTSANSSSFNTLLKLHQHFVMVVGLRSACDPRLRQAAWFLTLLPSNNDCSFEVLVQEMCVRVVGRMWCSDLIAAEAFFFFPDLVQTRCYSASVEMTKSGSYWNTQCWIMKIPRISCNCSLDGSFRKNLRRCWRGKSKISRVIFKNPPRKHNSL